MIIIKKIILLVSVLCISFVAVAQNESIRGTILDLDGQPVIGAAVIVQGTTIGTATDLDGKFILSVNSGQTIEISSIGFKTKTIVVTESREYNIQLEPDAQFLDEIVVVGYDTQKKVNLTGSVSSLPVEVMDNRPVVQASTALQGTMPGVAVSTHGGAPGDDSPSIRVRGLGTFGTSACKRICMYLRWMIRTQAPDLGLWRNHSQRDLYAVMDVHVCRLTAELTGMNQASWKNCCRLTQIFRSWDAADPLKYDVALMTVVDNGG